MRRLRQRPVPPNASIIVRGVKKMKPGKILPVAAAAVGLLCLSPGAFAAGEATTYPANPLTFSLQTVNLAGNQVNLPPGVIVYRMSREATAGDTIVIRPPTGASFILPVPTAYATSGACTFTGALAAGVLTYTTTACTRNTGQLEMGLGTATITGLTGLANPVDPGARHTTITAQGTFAAGNNSDAFPIPVLTLASANTFEFFTRSAAPNLGIDLTGTAASTPGAQFSTAAGGVSTAGFLGTFSLAERQDYDARGAAGTPAGLLATPLAGAGTATVRGNFTSITSAYLVTGGSSTSCAAPAPAGSVPGTVTGTALTFPFTTPAAFPDASTTWAVCAITAGGTAQISATPVTITATIAATGIATPAAYNLNPANEDFGAIVYNGSVTLFQNVFGANNFYPVFFRVFNPTGAAAPLFAVLAKDGAATFVTAGGALAAAPANNALQISADTVATAAGTTLVAGSAHATVKLLSPTTGVLFSAISQNAVTMDISVLQ